MKKTPPTCWILTPGIPAFRKQTAGIAQALGLEYQEKVLIRKNFCRFLPKNFTWGIQKQLQPGSAKLIPPWPDVIISCGSRMIPYALAIKKASKGATALIHVLKPTISYHHFDAIVTPQHDKAEGSNIIKTLGSTHDLTEQTLTQAKEEFTTRFAPFKQPFLSILLGGTTKKYTLTHERAAKLANTILKIAESYPGTLLITASRRTGNENLKYLERRFKDQKNIYFYNNIGKNPYMGMIALADMIMVTDDSVSMISEACFSGKPVYILRLPEQKQRGKIDNFIKTAMKDGYLRYFEGTLEDWDAKRLDETQRIAPELKQHLENKIKL